jgi:hypothetical protein
LNKKAVTALFDRFVVTRLLGLAVMFFLGMTLGRVLEHLPWWPWFVIAVMLGFALETEFRRAFKKWVREGGLRENDE